MGALALSIRKRVTSELDTRARVTSELSTATRIANAKTASPPATIRVRMLVSWLGARGASSCGSGSRRSSDRNNGMGSSEEGSVDGAGVWYAGCGSPCGSSNAKAFEPRDARCVVRSMALMLPSLRNAGEPPGAKAPVHSHTEVPGKPGTWRITSQTVHRSPSRRPALRRSARCCAAFVILTLLLEPGGRGKVGQSGPRSWKGDDDSPDMRRLGAHLFICAGIRRNLYCFSLWLQRRQNRIGRADESKCDDRGASRQTIRLSRHSHLTFHRAKRHRPDK